MSPVSRLAHWVADGTARQRFRRERLAQMAGMLVMWAGLGVGLLAGALVGDDVMAVLVLVTVAAALAASMWVMVVSHRMVKARGEDFYVNEAASPQEWFDRMDANNQRRAEGENARFDAAHPSLRPPR